MKPINLSSLRELRGKWDELGRFDLLEISDGRKGFFILLGSIEQKSELWFSIKLSDSYRVFDESDLIAYLENPRIGVYVVDSSEFLDWARLASYGLGIDLRHYLVVSANGVLEYLGLYPPEPVID